MKPASLALFALALVVAIAWPLSSAIGSASAGAIERMALRSAACVPEQAAVAPSDDGEDDDGDDDGDAVALPPGHPPIARQLPPGHPPISADGLPPGHPPIGRGLPPGHPPIPSGQGPASPMPVELFGAPVLLNI
jgi:hypothetical protein